MCGLSVIASSNQTSLAILSELNNLASHRGPDGQGRSEFKLSNGFHVGLAHRRLAIIDLSDDGLQPMSHLDLEIVFNGEIYNYLEIRDQLKKEGYNFKTDTDTEVILQAYKKWGSDCLQRFNGMFAIIILDKSKNELFVARDRFGVKPLYYFQDNESLYFVSEIKQLFAVKNFSPKLNYQAAYDFLNFGVSDHQAETFFQGVKQFKPSHYAVIPLEMKGIAIDEQVFYQLKKGKTSLSLNDAVEKFANAFRNSIKLRLRCDVKVGSCLSGGLDSSSIVLSAKNYCEDNKLPFDQATFSSCSKIPKYDESEYIKQITEQHKIPNHKVYPEAKALLQDLDQLVYQQDEPFISSSIYAQRKVFELASKEGVKVMLDGQGADEVLGGYPTFFKPLLFSKLKGLKLIDLTLELFYLKKYHGLGLIHFIKSIFVRLLPEKLVNRLRSLAKSESPENNYFSYPMGLIETRNPKSYNNFKINDITDFSIYLLTTGNLPMLLRYEDRNSMSMGIEARVPFLDFNLVDFCNTLPSHYKISRGMTKLVLRKAMKNILPRKISERKDKMGFVTAEEAWFKGEISSEFLNLIKESIATCRGIIDPKIYDDAQLFVKGLTPYRQEFWRAICFSRWVKVFKVNL